MKSIRHEEHRYTRKDTKKYVYEAEFVTEDKYCRVLFERLCKIQKIPRKERTVRPL